MNQDQEFDGQSIRIGRKMQIIKRLAFTAIILILGIIGWYALPHPTSATEPTLATATRGANPLPKGWRYEGPAFAQWIAFAGQAAYICGAQHGVVIFASSPDDGQHWSEPRSVGPGTFCAIFSQGASSAELLLEADPEVCELNSCGTNASRTLYRSFDAGAHWVQASLPHTQSQDDVGIMAVWVGGTLFLATAADDSLWVSAQGGPFRLQKLPTVTNECDTIGAMFVFEQDIYVNYKGGEQTVHPNCAFVSDEDGLQWHTANFQTNGQPLVASAASSDQRYLLAQDKNLRTWSSMDGKNWSPYSTDFLGVPTGFPLIQRWINIAPDGTVVVSELNTGVNTIYEFDRISKAWREKGTDSKSFTVSYTADGHPAAVWGQDSLGRLVMFPLV